MPDLEKTTKALKACSFMHKPNCESCPLDGPGFGFACREQIREDALTLLKALEPRLLTLEEVISHYSLPPDFPDDPYMKEEYMQEIQPLYFDFPGADSWAVHWRNCDQVIKYIGTDLWVGSYGKKWRCWTSKPTEEQRKGVAWNA